MFPDPGSGDHGLFTAMFSDEPVPDVEVAIVVAHPGDEAVCASWLMVRLQERASVFCLAKASHGCPGGLIRHGTLGRTASSVATTAAAALAGVPYDRCHNLGLSETELARDLQTLVWLTTAAVTSARPRVLVTHACEGDNLDHDATAFAVHMTARLMARCGSVAPLVVEIPRRQPPCDGGEEFLLDRQTVRIHFGPESRKVKRRMLRCHGDHPASMGDGALQGESYVLARAGTSLDNLVDREGPYLDAPWCDVAGFRREARDVASSLTQAVLSSPSRA